MSVVTQHSASKATAIEKVGVPWQLDIITDAIALAVSSRGTITPLFHWTAKHNAMAFTFHASCRRYSAWLDSDGSIRYYREAGQFISKLSRGEFVDGISNGFKEYYDAHTALHWPVVSVDNLKAALNNTRREWPEE
jgi:hypothetical protein